MRYLALALAAGAALLAASGARASEPLRQQVQLQARVLEVTGEFNASLGFDFNNSNGSYTSTSNEPFGSGSSTLLNGVGGLGYTLWFNTGGMAPAPGNPNGLNLGIGVEGSGFFGGDDDILRLVRHNNNDIIDTILNRSVDYAVDITARASVPILMKPRILTTDSEDAVIFIEPFVGASVVGTETEFTSDRTGIGGPVLQTRNVETNVSIVTGVGALTELGRIPVLGDIPILGGLFYKARRIPGTSASVTANGVTETGRVDSSWQHEALIVFVTPLIVYSDE